ncbi:hypothetical protein R4Y45_07295 [Holzapfeliella sp. He02]|uniref:Uncharacterized protein n=1 Tax=Holzapfeliella saturejae TaxID=3082953 RepID=A0ABU8SI60_9LACO
MAITPSLGSPSEVVAGLICQSGSLSKKEEALLKSKVKVFIDKKIHVPYDIITNEIFNNIDDTELESVHQNAEQKLSQLESSYPEASAFCTDAIRHIKLAQIQKRLIIEKSNKANTKAQEAFETAEKAEKIIGEMENIRKSIYTDFVSILGIFTAITFATFGGLQLLGNVFGNADLTNSRNLGAVIILGAIYIFGTYMLLNTLLVGIKKISSFGSSSQKSNKYADKVYFTELVEETKKKSGKFKIFRNFGIVIWENLIKRKRKINYQERNQYLLSRKIMFCMIIFSIILACAGMFFMTRDFYENDPDKTPTFNIHQQ